MTGTQNILWHLNGVEACEEGDFLKAVAIFQQISPPPAAILFNIGCCYFQLQQYVRAEQYFAECIGKDKYLAVGYFQLAVTQVYLQSYSSALSNFLACHHAMRGNKFIDYKQLNMNCKISDSGVRLNLALVYIFTGDSQNAMENLRKAAEIVTDEHSFVHVAAAALVDERWDVFGQSPIDRLVTLRSSCLFRPSKGKLDGLKSDIKVKDSAKVVSATDDTYSFVGFVGPKKLQKQRENEAELVKSDQSNITAPPVPLVAPPRRVKPPHSAPPPPPTAPPPAAPTAPPPAAPTATPPPPPTAPPPAAPLNALLHSPSKAPPNVAPPAGPPPSVLSVASDPSPNLRSSISEKLLSLKNNPAAILREIPSPPSTSPPTLRRNTPPVHKLSSSPAKLPPFPAKPFPPTQKKSHSSPLKVISSDKAVITQKNSGRVSPRPMKSSELSPAHSVVKPNIPVVRPPPPKGNFQSSLQCDLTVSLSIPKTRMKSYNDFTNIVCEKLQSLSTNILCGSCKICSDSGNLMGSQLSESTWKNTFLKGVRESKLHLHVKENGGLMKQRTLPAVPTSKELPGDDEDVYVDADLHIEDEDELYASAVFSQ